MRKVLLCHQICFTLTWIFLRGRSFKWFKILLLAFLLCCYSQTAFQFQVQILELGTKRKTYQLNSVGFYVLFYDWWFSYSQLSRYCFLKRELILPAVKSKWKKMVCNGFSAFVVYHNPRAAAVRGRGLWTWAILWWHWNTQRERGRDHVGFFVQICWVCFAYHAIEYLPVYTHLFTSK